MKYQDFTLASDREFKLIKQSYEKKLGEESADLQEISQKLQSQQEFLKNHNENGKYNNILKKFEESLQTIDNLISSNDTYYATKFGSKLGSVSSSKFDSTLDSKPGLSLGSFSKQTINDDGDGISPIRHNDEIANHSENNYDPNLSLLEPNSPQNPTLTPNFDSGTSSGNSPTLDDDTRSDENLNNDLNGNQGEISPNNTQKISTNKRNHPMQSNSIFGTFARSIAKLNSLFFTKKHQKKIISHNTYHTFSPYNPNNPRNPHNPFSPFSPINPPKPDCSNGFPHEYPPHNQPPHTRPPYEHDGKFDGKCNTDYIIKHNQIDIIRLFLLFMMLRPNCRHLSVISTVANTQFDILLSFLD